MCLFKLPVIVRYLSVVTFFSIAVLAHSNERVRLMGAAAPAAYQVKHGEYILYVSPTPAGDGIHLMLAADWQQNVTNAPSLIFRGSCAPAGTVHVSIHNIGTPEYKAFEASSSIDDFPFQNQLDLVREELTFQCPEMENITTLTSGDHLHENLKGWQASLRAENGWQLEAYDPSMAISGPVSVSFRAHQAGIRSQPIEYNVGADYEGLCEDQVTVALSVFPSPDNGDGSPSMANYEWASGNFTPALLQHCPELQRINYTMEPVPRAYYCPENCDIYASVESGWSFESGDVNDYSESAPAEFAESYADVIEVLGNNEDRRLLGGILFRSFYHRYLGHYSTSCQAYIQDSVPFQYTITTTTSDGYGTELYSDTETLDGITYVERAYAGKFDDYYSASKGKALGDIFGSVFGALGSGRAPSVGGMAYSLMQEDQSIIRHLEQGCTSESVQKVYANLYKRAHP